MFRRKDRPDPSERAAERMAAGLGPFEPLPEGLKRLRPRKILLYIVLAVVVIAIVRDGLGRGAPPVDGSCDRPGFAFDRNEVAQDGAVKWAVRGPSGAALVISAGSTRLLGPITLRDCRADGRFGVRLPDGDHTLRVTLDGREIGTAKLTVNAPH